MSGHRGSCLWTGGATHSKWIRCRASGGGRTEMVNMEMCRKKKFPGGAGTRHE